MPMPLSALGRRSCARRSDATACATGSSICRSRAAWRGATTLSRRPARRPASWSPRASLDFAGNERMAAEGIAVITVPDNRWERVDIKSVSLLPNVLAKQAAREQGAREAWFVDKTGRVTEGSSTNAWIVTATARWSRARATTPSCAGITRAVAARRDRRARPYARGAAFHRRGGLWRARGFRHLGEPDRHAGGADRRPADRQRRARPRRHGAAAGFPPHVDAENLPRRRRASTGISRGHSASTWACAGPLALPSNGAPPSPGGCRRRATRTEQQAAR